MEVGMFDNNDGVSRSAVDDKLRQNLQRFNRDSLRILHPVFVDALRLLARRDHPDRKDSLLLPLAWPGPRSGGVDNVMPSDMYPGAGQGQFGFTRLHGSV